MKKKTVPKPTKVSHHRVPYSFQAKHNNLYPLLETDSVQNVKYFQPEVDSTSTVAVFSRSDGFNQNRSSVSRGGSRNQQDQLVPIGFQSSVHESFSLMDDSVSFADGLGTDGLEIYETIKRPHSDSQRRSVVEPNNNQINSSSTTGPGSKRMVASAPSMLHNGSIEYNSASNEENGGNFPAEDLIVSEDVEWIINTALIQGRMRELKYTHKGPALSTFTQSRRALSANQQPPENPYGNFLLHLIDQELEAHHSMDFDTFLEEDEDVYNLQQQQQQLLHQQGRTTSASADDTEEDSFGVPDTGAGTKPGTMSNTISRGGANSGGADDEDDMDDVGFDSAKYDQDLVFSDSGDYWTAAPASPTAGGGYSSRSRRSRREKAALSRGSLLALIEDDAHDTSRKHSMAEGVNFFAAAAAAAAAVGLDDIAEKLVSSGASGKPYAYARGGAGGAGGVGVNGDSATADDEEVLYRYEPGVEESRPNTGFQAVLSQQQQQGGGSGDANYDNDDFGEYVGDFDFDEDWEDSGTGRGGKPTRRGGGAGGSSSSAAGRGVGTGQAADWSGAFGGGYEQVAFDPSKVHRSRSMVPMSALSAAGQGRALSAERVRSNPATSAASGGGGGGGRGTDGSRTPQIILSAGSTKSGNTAGTARTAGTAGTATGTATSGKIKLEDYLEGIVDASESSDGMRPFRSTKALATGRRKSFGAIAVGELDLVQAGGTSTKQVDKNGNVKYFSYLYKDKGQSQKKRMKSPSSFSAKNNDSSEILSSAIEQTRSMNTAVVHVADPFENSRASERRAAAAASLSLVVKPRTPLSDSEEDGPGSGGGARAVSGSSKLISPSGKVRPKFDFAFDSRKETINTKVDNSVWAQIPSLPTRSSDLPQVQQQPPSPKGAARGLSGTRTSSRTGSPAAAAPAATTTGGGIGGIGAGVSSRPMTKKGLSSSYASGSASFLIPSSTTTSSFAGAAAVGGDAFPVAGTGAGARLRPHSSSARIVGHIKKFSFEGESVKSPFLNHMTIEKHLPKYGDAERRKKISSARTRSPNADAGAAGEGAKAGEGGGAGGGMGPPSVRLPTAPTNNSANNNAAIGGGGGGMSMKKKVGAQSTNALHLLVSKPAEFSTLIDRPKNPFHKNNSWVKDPSVAPDFDKIGSKKTFTPQASVSEYSVNSSVFSPFDEQGSKRSPNIRPFQSSFSQFDSELEYSVGSARMSGTGTGGASLSREGSSVWNSQHGGGGLDGSTDVDDDFGERAFRRPAMSRQASYDRLSPASASVSGALSRQQSFDRLGGTPGALSRQQSSSYLERDNNNIAAPQHQQLGGDGGGGGGGGGKTAASDLQSMLNSIHSVLVPPVPSKLTRPGDVFSRSQIGPGGSHLETGSYSSSLGGGIGSLSLSVEDNRVGYDGGSGSLAQFSAHGSRASSFRGTPRTPRMSTAAAGTAGTGAPSSSPSSTRRQQIQQQQRQDIPEDGSNMTSNTSGDDSVNPMGKRPPSAGGHGSAGGGVGGSGRPYTAPVPTHVSISAPAPASAAGLSVSFAPNIIAPPATSFSDATLQLVPSERRGSLASATDSYVAQASAMAAAAVAGGGTDSSPGSPKRRKSNFSGTGMIGGEQVSSKDIDALVTQRRNSFFVSLADVTAANRKRRQSQASFSALSATGAGAGGSSASGSPRRAGASGKGTGGRGFGAGAAGSGGGGGGGTIRSAGYDTPEGGEASNDDGEGEEEGGEGYDYFDEDEGFQDTAVIVANLHADPLYRILREEIERLELHEQQQQQRGYSGGGVTGVTGVRPVSGRPPSGTAASLALTKQLVPGLSNYKSRQLGPVICAPELKTLGSFLSLPPAVWMTCRLTYFLLLAFYECVALPGRHREFRYQLNLEPLWCGLDQQVRDKQVCMADVEFKYSWPMLQEIVTRYPVLVTRLLHVMEHGLPNEDPDGAPFEASLFFNAFPPTKLLYLRDLVKQGMGLLDPAELIHTVPVSAQLCDWCKRIIARIYSSCLTRLRCVHGPPRSASAGQARAHSAGGVRTMITNPAAAAAVAQKYPHLDDVASSAAQLPGTLKFVLAVEDALDAGGGFGGAGAGAGAGAAPVHSVVSFFDGFESSTDQFGSSVNEAGNGFEALGGKGAGGALSHTLEKSLNLVKPSDSLDVLLLPPNISEVYMQLQLYTNSSSATSSITQQDLLFASISSSLSHPYNNAGGGGGGGELMLLEVAARKLHAQWLLTKAAYEHHLQQYSSSPLHRVVLLPPPTLHTRPPPPPPPLLAVTSVASDSMPSSLHENGTGNGGSIVSAGPLSAMPEEDPHMDLYRAQERNLYEQQMRLAHIFTQLEAMHCRASGGVGASAKALRQSRAMQGSGVHPVLAHSVRESAGADEEDDQDAYRDGGDEDGYPYGDSGTGGGMAAGLVLGASSALLGDGPVATVGGRGPRPPLCRADVVITRLRDGKLPAYLFEIQEYEKRENRSNGRDNEAEEGICINWKNR
jgi:hypothetical protein